MVHIDNSRADDTSIPRKLALTVSFEAAVHRAVKLDFQELGSVRIMELAFSFYPRKGNWFPFFLGLQQLQELSKNRLDPLSFDTGCVQCLPQLSAGHVIGVYDTFPATPLVKANIEKGYSRYIPTTEGELRHWWQYSYNVSLKFPLSTWLAIIKA